MRDLASLDEAVILACSVYVGLNPIRAGLAATPEEPALTSARDRIRSMFETSSRLTSNDEHSSLDRSYWVQTVRGFGRLFKQAAGRSSLARRCRGAPIARTDEFMDL